MLEFCRFREVIAIYNKQSGEVDASVLIGLHLKALAVPVDGVAKALLIFVLGLHKLILQGEESVHVSR